jgi:hypothetical protein
MTDRKEPAMPAGDDLRHDLERVMARENLYLNALQRIAEMTDVEADFDGFEARRNALDAIAAKPAP